MSSISTNKILRKLERIVDFRVGEGASEKHPIVVQEKWVFGGSSGPATDGNQIFLPRKEKHFSSERDNELFLACVTAHEADHIRELDEYFGEEVEALRKQGGLVEEFLERNYSELEENPALAGWIDNVVKDRRIDAQRKEQLPGVKRFDKVIRTCARYFRPSTKKMKEIDVFRELYLQQALFGDTLEPVPDKYKKLLKQVVGITYSADSINKDSGVVTKVYQLFKENFDITPPTSKLPPLFGRRGHGSGRKGKPKSGKGGQGKNKGKPKDSKPNDSQGNQKKDGSQGSQQSKPENSQKGGSQTIVKPEEIKPRQGRSGKDKTPKQLDKNAGKPGMDEDKKPRMIAPAAKKEDRGDLYKKAGEEAGTSVDICEPKFSKQVAETERDFKHEYAGEIQSMKRIFRKLKLKHYGDKRDLEGYELDYEEFLQSELEEKVTGIKGGGRVFRTEVQNRLRPAWAVLADISRSTDPDHYNIIKQIKASLLVQGEALGITDFPFGLYAFSTSLYVIKDFVEKYGPEVADKIVSVKRRSDISEGSTNLGPSLKVVGEILKKQKEQPKGITIVTDGEANNRSFAGSVMKELYDQKIYPFLIVVGREFEGYAQSLTDKIGEEHYSIIDKDKLYELPGEMFRLFKTYGIAR